MSLIDDYDDDHWFYREIGDGSADVNVVDEMVMRDAMENIDGDLVMRDAMETLDVDHLFVVKIPDWIYEVNHHDVEVIDSVHAVMESGFVVPVNDGFDVPVTSVELAVNYDYDYAAVNDAPDYDRMILNESVACCLDDDQSRD